MVNTVTDPLIWSQMEYVDIIKDLKIRETWSTSIDNELFYLAQGVGEKMPTVLDTVNFISKDEFPKVNLHFMLELCARYALKIGGLARI